MLFEVTERKPMALTDRPCSLGNKRPNKKQIKQILEGNPTVNLNTKLKENMEANSNLLALRLCHEGNHFPKPYLPSANRK
jgi:hypothetical protein